MGIFLFLFSFVISMQKSELSMVWKRIKLKKSGRENLIEQSESVAMFLKCFVSWIWVLGRIWTLFKQQISRYISLKILVVIYFKFNTVFLMLKILINQLFFVFFLPEYLIFFQKWVTSHWGNLAFAETIWNNGILINHVFFILVEPYFNYVSFKSDFAQN